MSHSPPSERSGASARTVVGVVLGLAAAALLLWASFVFVFYGYCEDACDKPPRTLSGALGAAGPSALVALALMVGACYLFMRSPRARRPSRIMAAALAVASSAAFIVGLWVLTVGLGTLRGDSGALFLLGMLVLVPAWIGATIAAARHFARHR
jgi:hypothetical protein